MVIIKLSTKNNTFFKIGNKMRMLHRFRSVSMEDKFKSKVKTNKKRKEMGNQVSYTGLFYRILAQVRARTVISHHNMVPLNISSDTSLSLYKQHDCRVLSHLNDTNLPQDTECSRISLQTTTKHQHSQAIVKEWKFH